MSDERVREALRAMTWTMGASARIPVERRDEWCAMAERLFFAELAMREHSEPDLGRRSIEHDIVARVVTALERVVADQALNTPLNREALISVVRTAAHKDPA